jgi:hypothetical protein
MVLAIIADALQIVIFPLFVEGALSPADDILDFGIAAVLVHLLGWHWEFYYVTDHYLSYSAVLVRLSRVTPDVLRDLLGMAHKFVTSHEAARRSPSRHRRKPA